MLKKRTVMKMLLKGGYSQSEVAAAVHVSKRDVSECAKLLEERGLTAAELAAMGDKAVEALFGARATGGPSPTHLQPDMAAYVERKKRNRKLPLLLFWSEYCHDAVVAGLDAYAYSTFCQKFAEEAERSGATRHFDHVPGAKGYIDWCGDVAHLTDRVTGTRAKVFVFVIELPFSHFFWAEGFCDMKQASWQAGHTHGFEYFGGVPGMLVPDNAPTATNRSAPPGTTVLNEDYERFAEHYGTAVLPARVRKPRDKSSSETTVDLVETWIIAPSEEMRFYTIEEFNDYCAAQVDLLNDRPFSAKDGSRREIFEDEERDALLPLPPERYELCTWSRPKVAPNYHVQIDYMRYSVPHTLIGETVDAKSTATTVTIYHDNQVVATHKRLHGRRNQYSTQEAHMPESHRALDDPWSKERFEKWALRIGPETSLALSRLMGRRKVVQQAFVDCRNILGLADKYTPELLERACASLNEVGASPTYTGLKNRILALGAQDAQEAPKGTAAGGGRPVRSGLTRGADAYKRDKGGE